MKKLGITVVLTAIAFLVVTYAAAEGGAAASQPQAAKLPSGVVAADAVSMTATVDMIDLKHRIVTLRGADGIAQDFVAGPEVKNLAQVKPGDKVSVKYFEALAWEVKKSGSASPGASMTEGVVRAEPGMKPEGAAGRKTTVTVTITAIDSATHMVTLKGPEGNVFRVKAKNPKNLEAVKVGDMVDITYSQALVIAVEPGGKQ